MENLYIQSTLNAQQAFEAMQAGKNVLCKSIGGEFDTLDQFPATVFFKPDYEFALALQTIALNGITFTAPLTLPELEDNQELFIVGASSIKKMQFKGQIEVLTAVKNGFAQRDEDNAKNHLKAMCLSFGVTDPSIIIEGVFTTPKKKASKKTNQESVDIEQVEVSKEEQPYPEGVDIPEPAQIEKIIADIANNSAQQADDGLDELIPNTESLANDASNEPNPLVEKVNTAIAKCASEYELDGIELNLEGNKDQLYRHEYEELLLRINEKRESFAPPKQPEQLIPAVSKFDEIRALIIKANSNADLSNVSHQILSNQKKLSNDDLGELQSCYGAREELINLKADLIERASTAATPVEANALITYTKSWDESDRKPVLDAINARLCELGKPEIEKQSLLVRIQGCQNLPELEEFVDEINALNHEIRPRMQQIYESKKQELSELPF